MGHYSMPFAKLLKSVWNKNLQNLAYFSFPYPLRSFLMRMKGVKLGRNVIIGSYVYIDDRCPERIEIGEGSMITARCIIIAHQRNLSEYRVGDFIGDHPLKESFVKIGKGVHLGMGSIVLPGVTIGDGSIIGAGSVVSRDIPSYVIAAGVPAKVIKEIQGK